MTCIITLSRTSSDPIPAAPCLSAGMSAIPALIASGGDIAARSCFDAGDGHSAALRGRRAEHLIRQCLKTAAHQAGEAEDFALVEGEGDVLDRASRDAVDRHVATFADGVFPLWVASNASSRLPMIISMSWSFLVAALSTVPATRPSRRTVMRSVTERASSRSCDTSGTLDPCVTLLADDVEEAVPVLAGQEHGRFVEHQQPATRLIVLRVHTKVVERTDDGQTAHAAPTARSAHDRADRNSTPYRANASFSVSLSLPRPTE